MGTHSAPVSVTAVEFLSRMDEAMFQEPPEGHFWLEHLVRALAQPGAGEHPWRLYAAREGDGPYTALYAVSSESGYALFHATGLKAGSTLLSWALEHAPPHKVLSSYILMERVLEAASLKARVTRDHRELFLTLPPGHLALEPDWAYRLATRDDIPRLVEYNELYNKERETSWTRDWEQAIARRTVYVRERDGVVSSCLMRGALLAPRVSFGGTFTFPEFRGLGDATMLVVNFCGEMALYGLEVCLIVDDDNPAAIRVYTKAGFTPRGLYRTTYFG